MKRIHSKIAIVIGTRAELIKTFPIMIELESKKTPYCFIHTGQHNLGDLCEKFGIKKPDIVLSEEPGKDTKFYSKINLKTFWWNVKIMFGIRKALKKLRGLRYVLYHGDTMNTATAAGGASRILNPFKKYKSVHLEAGLRSWDWKEPFPEEATRVLVGYFSDVLMAVSTESKNNLHHHKNKRIILSGNTILDSANIAYELSKKIKIKELGKRYALISIHRYENLKSKDRMEKIVEIICSTNIPTYWPLHGNCKKRLIEYGLMDKILNNKNIKILPPKDYLTFINHLAKCSLIICDGGSLQEESLIFKKPCIILRKATERPEGLESNFQFLSKLDVEKTKKKIGEYLHEDFKVEEFENPYGEKGLSKTIVEFLLK
jgi:UDP-N-acetylglucosamine 2-epimerase (non-hydrolysing)